MTSNLKPFVHVVAWPKQKNRARNPFQFLLYKSMEKTELATVEEFSHKNLLSLVKTDIIHIHWPDAFLAAGKGWKFWPRLIFLRLLFFVFSFVQVKTVWTAHNFQREGQRNSQRLATYFWPWFLEQIDGIVFMTEVSKTSALSKNKSIRGKPNVVIPHGHYKSVVDNVKLDNNSDVSKAPRILFFGSITRYKNAYKLLEAFLALPLNTAELRFTGKMSLTEPDLKLQKMLSQLPKERESEVFFENRFLTDQELVSEINDSDIVVFPYSDVLNSGAAIFALSVGRPLLVSDTPLFRELELQVGSKWVRIIKSKLDAPTLLEAIEHAKELKESKAQPDLSFFNWNNIAAQTLDFYRCVLAEQADK